MDSKYLKSIILPPKPSITTEELKEISEEKYDLLLFLLQEMSEVAACIGGSEKAPDALAVSMRQALDYGIISFGIDAQQTLHLLLWNYVRGAYLPVKRKYFSDPELALSVQMAAIVRNVN